MIGGSSLPYNDANLTAAVAGLSPGATVTGAATTGFNINYAGGVDVPNAELVDLSCGGCFASVQETNHGGAFDSFRLNYDGTLSAPIVNGTNYTARGGSARAPGCERGADRVADRATTRTATPTR